MDEAAGMAELSLPWTWLWRGGEGLPAWTRPQGRQRGRLHGRATGRGEGAAAVDKATG